MMPITREALERLLAVEPLVDRCATISSDGHNLLIRLPKRIREVLDLRSGQCLRFLVDSEKRLSVEVIRSHEQTKKKRS